MNRKKIYAVIGIVCIVVLASSLGVYFAGQRTKNSWLSTNDYMVYKQDFSWAGGNATEYMFWNVTSLNGALANIHLVSHGVDVSNGSVIFS